MTSAIVPPVHIGTGTLKIPSKSEFHHYILTFRHSTHSTQIHSTRSSLAPTHPNTRTVSPGQCPSALLWWCETSKMSHHPVFKLQPSPQHCHVSVHQEGVTEPGCFLQLHTKRGCTGHSHYKHIHGLEGTAAFPWPLWRCLQASVCKPARFNSPWTSRHRHLSSPSTGNHDYPSPRRNGVTFFLEHQFLSKKYSVLCSCILKEKCSPLFLGKEWSLNAFLYACAMQP